MSARIDYISVADLEATLNVPSGSPGSADRQAAVTAASRAIDGICQRVFDPGSGPEDTESRFYTAEQAGVLEIDDLYCLTSLQTDDANDGTFSTVWTRGVDFELIDLNAELDGEPWTHVQVRQGGAQLFMPGQLKGVEITGWFGWPAVPQDVVTATTLLASRVYELSRNAPLDVVIGVETMIRLGSRIPNVMMLLSRYQRHKVSVA